MIWEMNDGRSWGDSRLLRDTLEIAALTARLYRSTQSSDKPRLNQSNYARYFTVQYGTVFFLLTGYVQSNPEHILNARPSGHASSAR